MKIEALKYWIDFVGKLNRGEVNPFWWMGYAFGPRGEIIADWTLRSDKQYPPMRFAGLMYHLDNKTFANYKEILTYLEQELENQAGGFTDDFVHQS